MLLSLPLLLGACAAPAELAIGLGKPPAHWGLSATETAPGAAEAPGLGPGDSRPAETWWRALGDPALADLIERALREAPSLAIAQARAEQALALSASTRAAQQPQVTAGADLLVQRYSANALPPPPVGGSTRALISAQSTLAWSPDFAGVRAAASASAEDRAIAAQIDASGAAHVLASQVARAYVALGRAVSQRKALQDEAVAHAQRVALLQRRVAAGLEPAAVLERALAAQAAARGRMLAFDEQVVLGRRQLAALVGLAPDALDGIEPQWQSVRARSVPERLGADLLGRRADVVAARWRVESALQDLKGARAQFYPDVNLSAFVGLASMGLSNWLELGSRQAGVGPALRLPVFDGERLASMHLARQAQVREAVAIYDATVLAAVHEAGSAMARLRSAREQAEQHGRVVEHLRQAMMWESQRRQAGLVGALAEAEARLAWLEATTSSWAWQALVLDAHLALVQALGGDLSDSVAATVRRGRT